MLKTLIALAAIVALSGSLVAEDKKDEKPKFTPGSCCDKAAKDKKECAHKCCVEAAKDKKVCEKCNKPKKS